MKKLIHIIPNLNNGGAENFLINLSKNLTNSFDQIIINTTGSKSDYLIDQIPKNIEILYYSETPQAVVGLLKKYHASKVLCWMYHSIFWIFKISIKENLRFANLIWNIRHSKFSFKQIKQKVILFLIGIYSQYLKPRIIYCGNVSKQYHQSYFFYKKRSTVIHNRLAKQKPIEIKKIRKHINSYLYVGRHDFAKGPDILMDVFKKILKTKPDSILLIAGGGWEESFIDEHLRRNIVILGNYKNVFDLYNSVKALVFTSRSEGYPNVIVEAAATGCPIYALKSGDISYILKDYPLGFLFKDKIRMSKKILENFDINWTNEREKIAKNFIANFKFEKTIKEYIDFLK